MPRFALALLGLAIPMAGGGIPCDAVVVPTRMMMIPLEIDPAWAGLVERLRLFVSEDRGRSWSFARDCSAAEKSIRYLANRDGELWFAIQVAYKSGQREPERRADLQPALKICVTSGGKMPIRGSDARPNNADDFAAIQNELKELRQTLKRLQRRLSELEAERKPKVSLLSNVAP